MKHDFRFKHIATKRNIYEDDKLEKKVVNCGLKEKKKSCSVCMI